MLVSQLLALGICAIPTVFADSYANFFDDQSCSENGGIGVDLYNKGCLNQPNRGSVYLPEYRPKIMPESWIMCSYTQADCVEESRAGEGWQFTSTGFCSQLPPAPGVVSYRFLRAGLEDCDNF